MCLLYGSMTLFRLKEVLNGAHQQCRITKGAAEFSQVPGLTMLTEEDPRQCEARLASREGCCRASRWRLTARCHGYTIGGKAVRVRMLHSELKWEILLER